MIVIFLITTKSVSIKNILSILFQGVYWFNILISYNNKILEKKIQLNYWFSTRYMNWKCWTNYNNKKNKKWTFGWASVWRSDGGSDSIGPTESTSNTDRTIAQLQNFRSKTTSRKPAPLTLLCKPISIQRSRTPSLQTPCISSSLFLSPSQIIDHFQHSFFFFSV